MGIGVDSSFKVSLAEIADLDDAACAVGHDLGKGAVIKPGSVLDALVLAQRFKLVLSMDYEDLARKRT